MPIRGTAPHRSSLALTITVLVFSATTVHAQPMPFRDPAQGRWGYKQPDGRVVISPRFLGAGAFRDGRAPVEDRDGFAIVDETGRVVERISIDSVSTTADPAPAPDGACASSPAERFPSVALECYIRQLRRAGPVIGGALTRRPPGRESSSSAVILKLSNGVIVHEDIGYEGFRRRVLLPGVSPEQALDWRRMLYPDRPEKPGCGESWSSGAIAGGAFIEQHAGC